MREEADQPHRLPGGRDGCVGEANRDVDDVALIHAVCLTVDPHARFDVGFQLIEGGNGKDLLIGTAAADRPPKVTTHAHNPMKGPDPEYRSTE